MLGETCQLPFAFRSSSKSCLLTFSIKSKCLGLEVLWPGFLEPEGNNSGRLRDTVPACAPPPATSHFCPCHRHGPLACGFHFLAALPTLLGTPHHPALPTPAKVPQQLPAGAGVRLSEEAFGESCPHATGTLAQRQPELCRVTGRRSRAFTYGLWGSQGRAVVDIDEGRWVWTGWVDAQNPGLQLSPKPHRGSQDHSRVPFSGLHSLESSLIGHSVLLRAPLQAAPGPGAWTATPRHVGHRSGAEPALTSALALVCWALGAGSLEGMVWLVSVLGC